jgi:hypothetical protein
MAIKAEYTSCGVPRWKDISPGFLFHFSYFRELVCFAEDKRGDF